MDIQGRVKNGAVVVDYEDFPKELSCGLRFSMMKHGFED